MVNHMVILLLTEASIKGTRYHPTYFYYVQKGYILSYNKLKIQVQSKEYLFVMKGQRFLICSLQTTACSFVEQILKSVPLFWKFCNNMKKLQANKSTETKHNFFSTPIQIHTCRKISKPS